MPDDLPPDLDPARFTVHAASPRGFRQAFVREGVGGVPLVCVHGWPETKRIFWKVIEPLAAAGFEVIVPDLRGFGDSDARPRRLPRRRLARARPLRPRPRRARPRAGRAHGRRPRWSGRPGPGAAPPRLGRPHGAVQLAAAVRQGAHGRACARGPPARPATTSSARAPTPTRWPPSWPPPASGAATSRRSTRRGSGPIPGAFDRRAPGSAVDFHTEPFADGAKLRACFGGYESTFDADGAAGAGPGSVATPRRPRSCCSGRPTT